MRGPGVGGSTSRVDASLLGLAGLLFVAFPVVRPYGDGSANPKVVAETFASGAWVAAHILGLLAFILLPLGLRGVGAYAKDRRGLAYLSFLICAVGSGLTAAFFGAEAFGLHFIGGFALREGRADALDLANELRFGPGIVVMSAGLLAVALGTVLTAVAVWSSGLARWSIVALAAGVVLWGVVLGLAAQSQPVRIAEALVIAVGSLSLAWQVNRLGMPAWPDQS